MDVINPVNEGLFSNFNVPNDNPYLTFACPSQSMVTAQLMSVAPTKDAKDKPTKPGRKRFSEVQQRVLEEVFSHSPSPSSTVRSNLAVQLGLSERSVVIWFQNRRAKYRRDLAKKEAEAAGLPTIPEKKPANSKTQSKAARAESPRKAVAASRSSNGRSARRDSTASYNKQLKCEPSREQPKFTSEHSYPSPTLPSPDFAATPLNHYHADRSTQTFSDGRTENHSPLTCDCLLYPSIGSPVIPIGHSVGCCSCSCYSPFCYVSDPSLPSLEPQKTGMSMDTAINAFPKLASQYSQPDTPSSSRFPDENGYTSDSFSPVFLQEELDALLQGSPVVSTGAAAGVGEAVSVTAVADNDPDAYLRAIYGDLPKVGCDVNAQALGYNSTIPNFLPFSNDCSTIPAHIAMPRRVNRSQSFSAYPPHTRLRPSPLKRRHSIATVDPIMGYVAPHASIYHAPTSNTPNDDIFAYI
ncbi:hypothetical protein BC832DRAFT_75350 [Gaertneriomyces semiglobifer]|nr:hypothetical protein BC832DRAFT_75350 [Gaertneriomyces semiglobifer]